MTDNIARLKIEKTPGKDPKKRFKASGLVILSVMCMVIAAAVSSAVLSKGIEVKEVTVSEIYPSQLISQLSASGYVVAQRKADVASKITGQLVSLDVHEGSMVKEGQVIARLENADAAALVDLAISNLALARTRLVQTKADMENASIEYNRRKNLVLTGAISRSEFDSAHTRFISAKASYNGALEAIRSSTASLRSAEAALSYSEIRAPFDAVVLTKNADVGDIITPLGSAANAKAAVVTIADLDSLQVEADVSESNIKRVQVDQSCVIALDALPGERFQGVVDAIVPTVDRSKATVLVKIRFLKKDPRILTEMSAKVGFLSRPLEPGEHKARIMVDKSAVVHSGPNRYAFFINKGKARKAEIKTGREYGDMVEVLQGLKSGDIVVSRPPEGFRDGSEVTVVQ